MPNTFNADEVGSSPHTWGTRWLGPMPFQRQRFIPTHVGNTKTMMLNSAGQCGSSPHTWGTHGPICRCQTCPRFIPTHVGNTPLLLVNTFGSAVHPHTRGEHAGAGRWHASCGGSSPHTWGTLVSLKLNAAEARFIPTHVGNTAPAWCCASQTPVHPHTRGEHAIQKTIEQNGHGSSPHTWGTQQRVRFRPGLFRFIPTHVGNTADADRRPGPVPVHPHTRGEHFWRQPG